MKKIAYPDNLKTTMLSKTRKAIILIDITLLGEFSKGTNTPFSYRISITTIWVHNKFY